LKEAKAATAISEAVVKAIWVEEKKKAM